MFIIFEGCDGAGKSTTMRLVAKEVQKYIPNFNPIMTSQPGSTPLGRHIRQLVKYPTTIDSSIEIDNLSRQLLYMVDMVNYINTVLKPSLEKGIPVFADRTSFISGMIYGLAEGLSYNDIKRLFSIIDPIRANRCYILICDPETARERMEKSRDQNKDYFDTKPLEFAQKLYNYYKDILNGPVEQNLLLQKSVNISDIHVLDTNVDQTKIVDFIAQDIINICKTNSGSKG